MASIIQIGIKWRAQVRMAGHKPQTKTFPTHAQAATWARRVEGRQDDSPASAHVDNDKLTVSDLIQAYREMRESGTRPIDDTSNEHYMLNILDAHLGDLRASAVTTRDLMNFCKARKLQGAGPYTINMDISKLGTVYRHTASYLGDIRLPDVVGRARPSLSNSGAIGSGGIRERRPQEDELHVIYQRLSHNMAEVVRFAIASCMRREEITLLKWADLDRKKKCIWIRDRKDPRNKAGNDQFVPLLGEAWDILIRQPQTDERIFPFHPQTISKAFTEACRDPANRTIEEIPDLHFHDMRHEGISRLFEQGYEIQQVALVSGHKNWSHLRRYTNLKPESLHHLHQKKPDLKLVVA